MNDETEDPKDAEIFRLRQLLYAAEARIDELESKSVRQKKYRMSKKESRAWDDFEAAFDLVQADEFNLWHTYCRAGLLVKCDSGCWKRSELQEDIHEMWQLGMDLWGIANYGDNPRAPVLIGSRYPDSFNRFQQAIYKVKDGYKKLKSVDERHAETMLRQVQKVIQKFEELENWKA